MCIRDRTWKLYSKALEYADLHGEETVWDLYCGIGTISLFLAQKAKFVRGVEIVPAAIEDAKRNAQINHIENVEFFVGKAEEVLPREYEKNGVYADVIVVDPPDVYKRQGDYRADSDIDIMILLDLSDMYYYSAEFVK